MSKQQAVNHNVEQAVPFFRVADMKESLRFYVEGLGFLMADKWEVDGIIRWCLLVLGKATIMLQQFPRQGEDSWVPQCKVGEGVSVCFMCNDAVSIWREVTARGLTASRPVVGNGLWVTSVTDPDGYRLDFESPTDALEDTVFSER